MERTRTHLRHVIAWRTVLRTSFQSQARLGMTACDKVGRERHVIGYRIHRTPETRHRHFRHPRLPPPSRDSSSADQALQRTWEITKRDSASAGLGSASNSSLGSESSHSCSYRVSPRGFRWPEMLNRRTAGRSSKTSNATQLERLVTSPLVCALLSYVAWLPGGQLQSPGSVPSWRVFLSFRHSIAPVSWTGC
jgi:hypothetical protein